MSIARDRIISFSYGCSVVVQRRAARGIFGSGFEVDFAGVKQARMGLSI